MTLNLRDNLEAVGLFLLAVFMIWACVWHVWIVLKTLLGLALTVGIGMTYAYIEGK